MNLSVSLNKEELEQAVKTHLRAQGLEVVGAITFRIDHGDQREPGAGASASMNVRTVTHASGPAYDR